MTAALLFFISAYGLGLRAIHFLDPLGKLSASERFVGRLITGFLGVGFEILFFALATKNITAAGVIAFLMNAVLASTLYRRDFMQWRECLRPHHAKRVFLSWHGWVLGLLLVLFGGVVFQVLVVDSNGFPSGTFIGWGDVAYHLDMIGHLAGSDPFVLDQPIANGATLSYSFLVNVLSAALLRFGLSLFSAWYIPAALFSITLVFGLYAFGKRLFSGRMLAIVLVVLVLFGGGLGFIYFFQDLHAVYRLDGWAGIPTFLNAPLHQYTHMDMRTGGKPQSADSPLNIVWITPAISFFSHQRSFALGASLFIFVLLGWMTYGAAKLPEERRYFMRWLPLLGFLPFVHAHTFIAAAIVFSALAAGTIIMRGDVKPWVVGGAAAFLIALPQMVFMLHAKLIGAETGTSLLQPWWGWMTCQHSLSWFRCDPGTVGTDTSVVWFWTKNFGIIFWGWLISMPIVLRFTSSPSIRALIPASLLLFMVPNLVLFQPWEFDNNKVLWYWWLLASVMMLASLKLLPWRFLRTSLLVALVLVGSLAGWVDVSSRVHQTLNRVLHEPVADHPGYYGGEELAAASWIRANTKPNDAFLTSDGANNFVPMLTGRPMFLGFPGWLWTQGNANAISFRQAVARQFFRTGDPALLCGMGVRWMMWEPSLLNTYTEAKSANLAQLGNMRFTQDTPYGQRHIVQLYCPNSG